MFLKFTLFSMSLVTFVFQRSIGVYLHILEQERIVADSQGLTTGKGHVFEQNLPGSDKGKLFLVGAIGHLGIEIGENGWPLVILWMIGIVDFEVFNADPFWHVTGIAKIMVTSIGPSNQAGTDRAATSGHKNAVADNKFSLPGTAIIAAQVDEVPAVDGAILHR